MSERQYVHSNFGGQCQEGDIAPYVLVPGSKERVRKFAQKWDKAREVADHYEFLVYTGEYEGIPITACSTGIGGMSVSIAIEELVKLGGQTFLRVGVTGPLVDELSLGELVIARGAVRWDGTSDDYVRPEYPALAHYEVIMAAIKAAENLNLPYQYGVTGDFASLGADSREGFRHFLYDRTKPMRQALYDNGVLDGTGEAAALFVQCSIYGLRAGALNVNCVDKINKKWDPEAEEKAIKVGLETVKILYEWDQRKLSTGAKHVHPAIK
jgi:uridine phosphorylase